MESRSPSFSNPQDAGQPQAVVDPWMELLNESGSQPSIAPTEIDEDSAGSQESMQIDDDDDRRPPHFLSLSQIPSTIACNT